ncbi:MAG: ATP-binding protein [Thermodesulfobacteriota bacterium]
MIARVMRELGLIEEWGSGYRRVVEACRSGGYPIPEWEELGAAMRVGFRPHPASRDKAEPAQGESDRDAVNDLVNELVNEVVRRDLNERQLWVLRELASGRTVRGSMVAKRFGCSSATARRDLAALSRSGVIEFAGAPKTGTYKLKRPQTP